MYQWGAAPRRKIGFAATLTWAMAAATVHSYAVGPLAPFWRGDLLFSAFEIGLVATAVVGVAAVASVSAGALVDRLGGRRLLVALFVASGGGMVVMGFAPGLVLIVLGAGLGGVAQAVANPATNQLIGAALPPGRRGAYIGVKMSGVQAAGVLVGMTFPIGAIVVGWRPVLVIAGIVTVVLGLLSIHRFIPPEETTSGPNSGTAQVGPQPPVVKPSLWLPVSGFLIGMGISAVLTYVPLYVVDAGGSAVAGGAVLGVIGLVGVGSRIFWARHAERTGDVGPILALLGVSAAASAVLLLAFPSLGWAVLWVAAALNGFSAAAWNAPASIGVLRVHPQSVGRTTGEVYLGFLGGLVATPLILGFAIDITGSYHITWTVAALASAGSGWAGWKWGRVMKSRGVTSRAAPSSTGDNGHR